MTYSSDEPRPSASGSEAPSELERLRSQSQIDFDIEFFGRVLTRHAAYVDVLRCQGELLAHRGRHDEALNIDQRLAALRPDDCIVRYNLACSLSALDRKPEAIAELRAAFEAGYDDFEYLNCDVDLEGLRHEPAYRQLLAEFGRRPSSQRSRR